MATQEPSEKLDLTVTVAKAVDAGRSLTDDKVRSSLRKPLAISAGKEDRLKVWQRAEVTVICTVIVIVWGLLALPIVFYNMPEVRGEEA